ncbi:LpqB family beta-propeller domain-containing protein [Glycomyces buryatensis]|uniref:S9 family peptidase n=1 Tax=Glycomyces buryatensis TaxID=2570927 RepID=A0A4S8PPE5_9ACTN|nr:LpqB family beta-propeller domain-containing protein [Glycomyces buryatensis]THV32880.1 S9 family peptidase [Glycomyces buryatensis]
MDQKRLPYGTWDSPITVDLVAEGDGSPAHLGMVGQELWWTEPRPAEGGRRALIRRRPDGSTESVLPEPWNPRNRVLEYGGTPWVGTMTESGPLIVFSNYADQRLYRFEPDSGRAPEPLTPSPRFPAGLRWCDMVIDEGRGEVWAVVEDFLGERPTELRRLIAAVPLDGSAVADRTAVRPLTSDEYRFTTGPRVSADGKRAAWIVWNHPNMPWDETELRVAEITDSGAFSGERTIAGGDGESIVQVEWAPDGTLVFAGDRTGWWNLHRIDPDSGETGPFFERSTQEAEYGGPMWTLGKRWFQLLPRGEFAAIHGKGESRLGFFDGWAGGSTDYAPGPWTDWTGIIANDDWVYALGASPSSGYEIVSYDSLAGEVDGVFTEHVDKVDPTYYPVPEHRTFAGPNGREVHAHVYPPRNPDFAAPEGELPPYVIWVHGGPTSHVRAVLDLELAYFTSRGIGVAEVNYGGSTGYGREYRNRLREQWGVVDVEDCAAVARALADEGTADRARLAIRGGSAGGWTAAASLTSPASERLYACATIKYPILDLSNWRGDKTHDFESQYLESLIGPSLKVPGRYRERSPVNHAERITAPFILLQGLEDAICPPSQSEKLLAAVEGKGIPHAYRTYEGEQHGFRKASTIMDAVLAEHALYAQVFGFEGPERFELELEG